MLDFESFFHNLSKFALSKFFMLILVLQLEILLWNNIWYWKFVLQQLQKLS